MKKLRSILRGGKEDGPLSQGDKDFVAKHQVQVFDPLDDKAAEENEKTFTASNVAQAHVNGFQHGWQGDQDEQVYESAFDEETDAEIRSTIAEASKRFRTQYGWAGGGKNRKQTKKEKQEDKEEFKRREEYFARQAAHGAAKDNVTEASYEKLASYVRRTKRADDNYTPNREAGRKLALSKMWGDPGYGFKDNPKVPADGEWPSVTAKKKLAKEDVEQIDEISSKLASKAEKVAADKRDKLHPMSSNYDKRETQANKFADYASIKRAREFNKSRRHELAKTFANKLRAEEVEPITEISKKVLGNYIKKATIDATSHAFNSGATDPMLTGHPGIRMNKNDEYVYNKDAERADAVSQAHDALRGRRERGIRKAVDRLTGNGPKQKGMPSDKGHRGWIDRNKK